MPALQILRSAADRSAALHNSARCASEKNRRRTLHYFLVAPLHRAVTLEQMHQLAMTIADDLHLDVSRPAHELFEIDLVVSKCGFRFSSRYR